MVPLKYLSSFWRTLEISPINCEIKVILTWSENFCIVSGTDENQVSTFAITDTKINVPVVTLLIQDNAKLLQQLESDFNRKINWNKHQWKGITQRQNQYLDCLIYPSFFKEQIDFLFYHLKREDTKQVTSDR